MRVAYICSPYSAKSEFMFERNLNYARKLCKLAIDKYGCAPIAPHLYLGKVLDDGNDEQRKMALEIDKSILDKCDLVLVGMRYGITNGMSEELDYIREHRGMPSSNIIFIGSRQLKLSRR